MTPFELLNRYHLTPGTRRGGSRARRPPDGSPPNDLGQHAYLPPIPEEDRVPRSTRRQGGWFSGSRLKQNKVEVTITPKPSTTDGPHGREGDDIARMRRRRHPHGLSSPKRYLCRRRQLARRGQLAHGRPGGPLPDRRLRRPAGPYCDCPRRRPRLPWKTARIATRNSPPKRPTSRATPRAR